MLNFPTNQAYSMRLGMLLLNTRGGYIKKCNSRHNSEAKFLVNQQVEKLKFSQNSLKSSRGSYSIFFYHNTLERILKLFGHLENTLTVFSGE